MKEKTTSARSKRTTSKRATVAKPRATAAEIKKPAKARRSVAKTVVAKRKSTRRRVPVAIPAILLEGDLPALPTVSGPGEKFALGPTPPEQHFQPESAELPESYGTKRLHLTARDPHWLYANWDLTREQQSRCNQQSLDGHLILRIYRNEVAGQPLMEIQVHPESRHWFANVERAETRYAAEIGYYRKGRKWTRVATSGATLTPPETVSSDATVEFATIPVHVPFEKLASVVAQAVREHQPLARAVEEMRRAGHSDLPPVQATPVTSWTPEQDRALWELISLNQERRVWIGSLEITEMVRRQLEHEVSSMVTAQFGRPTSPGGDVSSVSSPFGGEQERGKGFWFRVNAELIIYGATEPDASVSIGGRKIQLRSDGSFTYRFALPDGKYELPAVAVSADGTDGRAAELKFMRATELRGDVGAQPQDPALKPPLTENV